MRLIFRPGMEGFSNDTPIDGNLDPQKSYNFIVGPYIVSLTGWTHTRGYAGGFLGGSAKVLINGLKPERPYALKFYQFCDWRCSDNTTIHLPNGEIVKPPRQSLKIQNILSECNRVLRRFLSIVAFARNA